jgi:hemoglobin
MQRVQGGGSAAAIRKVPSEFHIEPAPIFAEEGSMTDSLYKRLGGYDAIAAVADDLLARLTVDEQLGRFWKNRGIDGVRREKQLLIDFLCASAGGPLYYTGRDMKISHKGMGISDSDWQVFLGHVGASLATFEVPAAERAEILAFVGNTKSDIVE